MRRAASRYIAGSGLPGSPTSAATTPSTRTSKRSVVPVTSSTMAVFLLDDMRPVLMPASCNCRMTSMVDGNVLTPCSRTSALKKAFLRLPSPQTVSRPGVGGIAHGQLDAAGEEEVAHAVVARLAVHVAGVVGVEVEGAERVGGGAGRRPDGAASGAPPVAAPSRAARSRRYSSKSRFQAAACTAAVWVTTPSRSKMTASYLLLSMVTRASVTIRLPSRWPLMVALPAGAGARHR